MQQFIAALDQGTTSSRIMVFDRLGNVQHLEQVEHRQIYPRPGWVEHDPLEILENCLSLLSSAVVWAKNVPAEITSIGITNQRETVVAWNRRTGKPYSNAIVWQDTRSDAICTDLIENGGIDHFREKTGLPVATYFSGPKIKWLIQNNPALARDLPSDSVLFGTIDTWLIWNLTGQFVTDSTNASRTLLMDLAAQKWDEGLLDLFGIPKSSLPEILDSNANFGSANVEGITVPITAILGDQQAALFGQACFSAGQVKNTYGTGCFLLLNTGQSRMTSKHGLITTIARRLQGEPPVFALEGSVAIAGALVQWLRDNLGLINSSAEVETLAARSIDNGGVYFVPAFSGLYAPYWRPDARGVLTGLTRFANAAHIARAALEATAFQTSDVMQAMQKDAQLPINGLRVDGGMVRNNLLMQFQSDILGQPVACPANLETTAWGAAGAAGLTAGYWSSLEELAALWRPGKSWHPEIDHAKRQHLLNQWGKAVQRSFDWEEL